MPTLIVERRDGSIAEVPADPGYSLMEAIRDGGIDELLALCDGSCSCATCHVHLAPEHLASFPPMSRDEDDLLDSSATRDAFSRLSCQLIMRDDLDGLKLRIAAED